MSNKFYFILIIFVFILTGIFLFNFVLAEDLSSKLAGRILLQIQDKGQAWYIDPTTSQRAFLGRPADAFRIMKELGLGISERDYNSFINKVPTRLAGRILLRVESLGQAYYVNPVDLKLYYLDKPSDAYNLMVKLGLGITNKDLDKIPILKNYEERYDDNVNKQETKAVYPLHKDITATVFWVGEPIGNGSSEDNALSSWDDERQNHFGGYDDPFCRQGYYPCDFKPKENPFYVSLPFNDFNDQGERKTIAYSVVPWAKEKEWGNLESMMKNRWVKIIKGKEVCYGQVEDTGPYNYDDYNYVFFNTKPENKLANSAGTDVAPALRDCLKFSGLNNADNKIDWQFIDFSDVPAGSWTEIVTTSQVNWQ